MLADDIAVDSGWIGGVGAGWLAGGRAEGGGGCVGQQLNRDTMSFATKLSYIVYQDGKARDVMKTPKTDSGKVKKELIGFSNKFPGC